MINTKEKNTKKKKKKARSSASISLDEVRRRWDIKDGGKEGGNLTKEESMSLVSKGRQYSLLE